MLTQGVRARVHLAFLWIAFLLPPLARNVNDFRVAQRSYFLVTVLVSLGVLTISILARWRMPRAAVLAVVYAGVGVVYFGFTTLAFGPEMSAGDLIDITRPVVYLSFFLLPVFLPLDIDGLDRVVRHLVALLIVQVLFSAAVFVPALWPLLDVYKGRLSTDAWTLQFLRFSGTFGYPGNLSLFLGLGVAVVWVWQNQSRMRSRRRGTWFVTLTLITLLSGVFLTGSRAGIAALAMVLVLLGARLRLSGAKAAMAGLVFVLPVILIPSVRDAVLEQSSFAVEYLARLVDQGLGDGSAGHRLRELELSADLASRVFPFGLGPNREYISQVHGPIESMVGQYLGKFGLIGILFWWGHHVLLIGLVFRFKALLPAGRWSRALAEAWWSWGIVSVLLMGFVTAPADQYRGAVLFYTLSGHLVATLLRTRRATGATGWAG